MSELINFLKFWCIFLLISYQAVLVICNNHNGTTILSRRKRFIIFPEGSSFQLVFCLTYPALIAIGDIMLWGNTAALAFELPQDPYSPFNHRADPLHRRMDTKTIYFTDYNGKIIHQEPYKRKFIVNPAFAKRSVDGSNAALEYKIDRSEMHASKHTREFLKQGLVENVEFHRSGRAKLYQHIEGLLQGLGADGRMCLLKNLCEMGQSRNNTQGAFLQEIMRVVFTGYCPDFVHLTLLGAEFQEALFLIFNRIHFWPSSVNLPKSSKPDMIDEEYDAAYAAEGSCEELYPCTKKTDL